MMYLTQENAEDLLTAVLWYHQLPTRTEELAALQQVAKWHLSLTAADVGGIEIEYSTPDEFIGCTLNAEDCQDYYELAEIVSSGEYADLLCNFILNPTLANKDKLTVDWGEGQGGEAAHLSLHCCGL